MMRALAVAAIVLVCAACTRAPGDPPPRHFMQGGVWYPAATGYWFHQYATNDDVQRFMEEVGFACAEVAAPMGNRLRCMRGFRLPGILWRTDYAEFAFRRNGAVALAQSGCRFAFFESDSLSGACTPFDAKGAVYPGIEEFASMTQAMLRPMRIGQPVSMFRLPQGPSAPLQDAGAAVDQLRQWRFECEEPSRRFTTSFRGNVGEILEAACQQWSLRVPGTPQQSQQVILRYDSVDLAVLAVSVRLDDEVAALSPVLNTPREARTRAAPSPLTLETLTGERIEMPYNAIGTGSRQQTRDGFLTLTPGSQRALVQAYLEKQVKEWGRVPGKLSQAYLGKLEWYGPEALPHVDALASDERPELGAAILKYRCLEVNVPGMRPDGEAAASAMAACIDERRAAMPRSIATLDRLLAEEMRTLATMDARALNAFFDFRRDVVYAIALGPDGTESAKALDAVVAGKEGLDPGLTKLVAAALSPRDRPLQQR